MTRCSHGKGPEGWDNVITKGMVVEGVQRSVRVEICWKCGAWLSLGPANDDYDLAETEIDAGRQAADATERGFDVAHADDPCPYGRPDGECSACEEQHLAFTIWSHDTEAWDCSTGRTRAMQEQDDKDEAEIAAYVKAQALAALAG